MRSFSSRDDCLVTDEPFYASYLLASGLEHPGRDAVLASQDTNWQVVADSMAYAKPPEDCSIWYQKHMSQHMREEMLGPWLDEFVHVFLIRQPAFVIESYLKVFPTMSLAETGLPWQARVFQYVTEHLGRPGIVIDAADVSRNPEVTLRRLCHDLAINWQPAMLQWPAGPQKTDGVWGRHWYQKIWESTGFRTDKAEERELPTPAVSFLEEANSLYNELRTCCSKEIH